MAGLSDLGTAAQGKTPVADWAKSISGLGGQSASETYAGITREQWQDYKSRFFPWQDQLIEMANGQTDNQLSEERAGNAVDMGFKTSMGTLNRDRSRLGLSMTGEEAANESRLAMGAKSGAKASALLKARLHAQDRDNALLAGGAGPGLKSLGV